MSIPQPVLDLDAKDSSPKRSQPFGVMAISLNPSELTNARTLQGLFLL